MKLLLVDGSALLHRAYHAYPPFTTKTGVIVGAVYGVTSILISAIEEVKPTHLIVAWDLPKPTFRHLKYVGYKAQRPKADTEMVEQIPLVKEVIETLGVVQYAEEGFEADDVIGTLSMFASKNIQSPNSNNQKEGVDVVILTGDQDTMQLVNENVKVLTPAKGSNPPVLYGVEEVINKYGVRPDQIVDYKALIGDTSDNIPGVAGIGPVTASKLLKEFDSLVAIYDAVNLKSQMPNSKLNEEVKKKLVDGKDSAFMSQDLSRIVTDMKIDLKLEEMELKSYATDEVRHKLEELNFKSLIRRIFPGAEEKKKKNENQMGLF